MKIVQLELKEANQLVTRWHRHHKPVIGHRFSIGLADGDGHLVAAIIVGRPVARLGGNPKEVLEVTRLVTNGEPNACSILYSAACRAGKALGYKKIQTYILESENGVSLRAAGWVMEVHVNGRQWAHTDGKPRRTDQPICNKTRWSRQLNT